MGLRIIYGKSGTGKSTYIYNEIKEKLNSNSKIFVVVPEQFSFTAEQKLMDISNGSVINAEVLTLSRMAYRVLNEVGGSNITHLSKVGKAMIIYDILSKNKNDLKFLGKSDKNIELVQRMYSELKKHGISTEMLENVNTDNKYLLAKLKDINLIYSKFQEKISNNYIDENDTLSLLAEKLEYTTSFDNSYIYIDEFAGFTFQEYRIIEQLLKKVKQISVTVCADSLEESTNKESDIFYFNKITVKKILAVAKNAKVDIEKPVNLDNNYRLKNAELRFLEENIYKVSKLKYDENVKNIKLFLASNPYSEIEFVAKQIVKLVRDDNYRYKDISIISNNLEDYSADAKAIFEKYDIPIFIDEKKDLSKNILVKYISSLLDVLSKNYSYESMFNYIKSGLLLLEPEDIFMLENYCTKWNIRNNKWNQNFEYEPINDIQEKLNSIRKQIVEPLNQLKENLKNKNTGLLICKELYNFLIQQKIPDIINSKIESLDNIELANEYSASFTVICNVLDEIAMIFEKDILTFDKFKEILQIGLKTSGLGKIPATQDQVIMGDVDRSRSHKVKAIFIIGMNDGIFPAVNKDEGFLNDKDREILKSLNIELANGTTDNLYESQFNIYKTLTIAEEKLYLSYSSSDKEGKSLRPSIIVTKIKKLFKELKEESDIVNKIYEITTNNATFEEAINNYKEFLEGNNITDTWKNVISFYKENDSIKFNKALNGIYYTNLPDKISDENLQKLYGKTLKTSISKLERYRQCPFSFHLEYGLKLKDKQEFKIESIDTGSFMHEVIDSFFEIIQDENIDVKKIETDEIRKIVNRIIEEKLSTTRYYIFSSTPKFKVLTNRLKRVVTKSIEYIVLGLKQSDFNIYGTEIEFSNSSKMKPIVVTLEDGKKVELTGKIDRIDFAEVKGEKYIRIIDYKSSAKSVEYNKILAGLQIQLVTYLDAATESEEAIPAGILYFPLLDNIVDKKRNLTDEEISAEIKKMFKMKGAILANVDVVRAMDNKLDTGYSDIIPVHIGKEGNITSKIDSTLKLEEFENLQKYTKKIIKQISKEILKGKIDIRPTYDAKKTPCEYCKYHTICSFSTSIKGNEYMYIDKYDKKAVLEKIKEDLEKN